MVTFRRPDIRRFAVSTIGALVLSAACVGAAVSPARAATAAPTTVEAWQADVEHQLDATNDAYALRMAAGHRAEAVLALRFDAAGAYAGAAIARSSGNARLDEHALGIARRIAYPALPEALRGGSRTVAMRLFFGRADTAEQLAELRRGTEGVRYAERAPRGELVAVR